jgi:hypothetical protein
MGWSFRKAISFGPIRFNLSKRGMGISAGVRGARIGIDSKGIPYVTAGKGGFLYRQRLPHKGAQGSRIPTLGIIAAISAAILIASLLALR